MMVKKFSDKSSSTPPRSSQYKQWFIGVTTSLGAPKYFNYSKDHKQDKN